MKKNRTALSVVCAVFALMLLVIKELFFSDSVNFYVTSIAILLLSLLPFFISFEHKKISAREITLTATLIALAVVGRAAFYLIPQVKPIAAAVIVSSVCLGAQRGFIIGAFSAFVSNFIFGQGFWTPFQMVALGAVGLVSGIIFKYIERICRALTGMSTEGQEEAAKRVQELAQISAYQRKQDTRNLPGGIDDETPTAK